MRDWVDEANEMSDAVSKAVEDLNQKNIDQKENILAYEIAKAMLEVLERRTCNGTYDELILKSLVIFDSFEDQIREKISQKMAKM